MKKLILPIVALIVLMISASACSACDCISYCSCLSSQHNAVLCRAAFGADCNAGGPCTCVW